MNKYQSLIELQKDFCVEMRRISLKKKDRTGICSRCGKIESDHFSHWCENRDGSPEFLDVDKENDNKAAMSIEFIEDILKLNGWE